MTKFLAAPLLALMLVPALPHLGDANTLNRACMRSDRDGATRQMCRCIQKTANKSLSRADQRLAASFIKDPHRAQEIRQSDQRSHEIFWKRYKKFETSVVSSCKHVR